MQYPHISSLGSKVEAGVALAVWEVDRGPSSHKRLDHVGLTGDHRQVERGLCGCVGEGVCGCGGVRVWRGKEGESKWLSVAAATRPLSLALTCLILLAISRFM